MGEAEGREIKQRFIPRNSVWAARDKLLRLKYTASIRDFVKAYANLMLETSEEQVPTCAAYLIGGTKMWWRTRLHELLEKVAVVP